MSWRKRRGLAGGPLAFGEPEPVPEAIPEAQQGRWGLFMADGRLITFDPGKPCSYQLRDSAGPRYQLVEVKEEEPDEALVAVMKRVIMAELNRQCHLPSGNSFYLYNDDENETGIDGTLDLHALARAVLRVGLHVPTTPDDIQPMANAPERRRTLPQQEMENDAVEGGMRP